VNQTGSWRRSSLSRSPNKLRSDANVGDELIPRLDDTGFVGVGKNLSGFRQNKTGNLPIHPPFITPTARFFSLFI